MDPPDVLPAVELLLGPALDAISDLFVELVVVVLDLDSVVQKFQLGAPVCQVSFFVADIALDVELGELLVEDDLVADLAEEFLG